MIKIKISRKQTNQWKTPELNLQVTISRVDIPVFKGRTKRKTQADLRTFVFP